MIDERIDSGIEIAMITVFRQLPRKIRIISAVRHAAMTASRMTPSIEARTKSDWSASGLISSPSGMLVIARGRMSLIFWMMSSVDAVPTFMIITSAER